MKTGIFSFVLAILAMNSPALADSFCYSKHLREAIALNESRQPIYSQWSHGASEAVSDKLIRSERGLLFIAETLDLWDLPLEKTGHSVLCDDFVSMKTAAKNPLERNPNPESLTAFQSLDRQTFIKEFKSAWKKGSLSALAVTQQAIVELQEHPTFNCMTRHVLASMARVLYRTPIQMSESGKIARLQIKWIADLQIQGHLDSLKEVEELDRLAAPIQAQGVPVICLDVPVIPFDP